MKVIYRPGDYACVNIKPKGWKAWLADEAIREFTKSEYCHAVLITGTDGTIVESTPKLGVHEAHISAYENMQTIFSTTQLSDETRAGIVKTAYSLVGKDGYGFLDIAYIALYLQGWNWRWLENEVLSEKDKTICSQFIAMCGVANHVTEWLCKKTIPQLVFPADLAELALKH